MIFPMKSKASEKGRTIQMVPFFPHSPDYARKEEIPLEIPFFTNSIFSFRSYYYFLFLAQQVSGAHQCFNC